MERAPFIGCFQMDAMAPPAGRYCALQAVPWTSATRRARFGLMIYGANQKS